LYNCRTQTKNTVNKIYKKSKKNHNNHTAINNNILKSHQKQQQIKTIKQKSLTIIENSKHHTEINKNKKQIKIITNH